ncbi:MAG: hypothetical protein ABH807_02175 [Candidatus Shapirobacteria bacterium]
MTTLTLVAYQTRRIFKFGFLGLIAFFILKFAIQTGWAIYRQYYPLPPPPPNVSFGKLPRLILPSRDNPPQLNFKLETPTGGLPELSTVGKIYFIPHYASTFFDLDHAQNQAEKIGFRGQPLALDATRYRWTNNKIPETTLVIETRTGNFQFRYDYAHDQQLLVNKNYLPGDQAALQEARNFLSANNLMKDDLATGSAEFAYLRYRSDGLQKVASLSEADFLRVNLLRDNLDNLKILPPKPQHSLVSFLFSGSRESANRIVEIDFTYFPLEKQIFGTYPLLPLQQAWESLKKQEGHVANLGENQNDITIRKIYLAYYDLPERQNYLQLIYVFEGDRGFIAYLPAVDPKWLEPPSAR